MRKVMVLPDLHIPFHHTALLDLWMKEAEREAPDTVVIIGDFLDCYSISRFDKNPQRRATLQGELDLGRNILQQLRESVPATTAIHYLEGNHEDRLRKMLWHGARELESLRNLTIPGMLGLNDLDIQWHHGREPFIIDSVMFHHGNRLRKIAGNAAAAMSDEAEMSVVCGHTHRFGLCYRTTKKGVRFGLECGHLCDFTQMDYLDAIPNWQAAWVILKIYELGGVEIQPHVCHNPGRSVPPNFEALRTTGLPTRSEASDIPYSEPSDGSNTRKLLSVDDLMRKFGIGRRTVWTWVRIGRLPPPSTHRGSQHRAFWYEDELLDPFRYTGT